MNDDQVNDLFRTVGRLETKVDMVLDQQKIMTSINVGQDEKIASLQTTVGRIMMVVTFPLTAASYLFHLVRGGKA